MGILAQMARFVKQWGTAHSIINSASTKKQDILFDTLATVSYVMEKHGIG